MGVFSLRSQRTGQYKEFTLLEILKLLGDPVNDEIWLEDGEDVFNLSSFREIGSNNGNGGSGGVSGGANGGGATLNWSTETFSQMQGQSTISLQYSPVPPVLMVMLNGMVLRRNTDYQLEGKFLQLPFALNAQDSLQCIYTY